MRSQRSSHRVRQDKRPVFCDVVGGRLHESREQVRALMVFIYGQAANSIFMGVLPQLARQHNQPRGTNSVRPRQNVESLIVLTPAHRETRACFISR